MNPAGREENSLEQLHENVDIKGKGKQNYCSVKVTVIELRSDDVSNTSLDLKKKTQK